MALDQLKAAMGDMGSTFSRAADTASSGFDRLATRITSASQSMRKVGTVMSAAITAPLVAIGLGITSQASDLNESISAVETVYGSASASIIANSEGAARAVGMSRQEYLSAFTGLSAYAGMVSDSADEQAAFSESTVTAAADLASFYNTSPGDAMSAMQAGLRGEGDALERYGIILNQANVEQYALTNGLWDGAGAMDNATLIAARHGLIMEGLGAAQGDFQRTSGGLANQQRILAAELANLGASFGQVLLPYALQATTALRALAGWMAGLGTGAKTAVVGFAVALAAVGPLLVGIGTVLPALVSGFASVRTGLLAARVAMLAFGGPIAAVVAVLALLGVAYKTNFLGFGDAVRAVGSKIKDALGGIITFVQNVASAFSFFREFGKNQNPISMVLNSIGYAIRSINGGEIPNWLGEIADGFSRLSYRVYLILKPFQQAIRLFQNFRRFGSDPVEAALRALAIVFPSLSGPIKALGNVFDAIGAKIDEVTSLFRGFRTMGFDPLTAAVKALSNAFPALGGVISSVGDMIRAVGEVFRGLGNAIAAAFSGDWEGVVAGLKQAVMGVWDYVKGVFGLWTEIGQLVLDAFDAIPWGVVGSALVAGFTAAWNAVKGASSGLWDWLTDTLGNIAWGTVAEGVVSAIGDALRGAGGTLSGLWDWLTDTLSTAFDTMRGLVSQGIALAWDAITSINWSDYIPDVDWAALLGRIGDLASAVGGWLGDRIGSIPWLDIIGTIADTAGAIAGWVGDKFTAIPWLSIIGTIADTAATVGGWVANNITAIPWLGIIGTITDTAATIGGWVAAKLQTIPWLMIIGTITDTASAIGGWVASKLSSIPWLGIIGTISDTVAAVGGWVASKVQSVPWLMIIGTIGDTVAAIGGWVSSKLSGIPWMLIFTALSDTAGAIGGWIGSKLTGVPWMSIFTAISDTATTIGGWLASKLAGVPWMSIFTALGDTQAAIGGWVATKLVAIPWMSIFTALGDTQAAIGGWLAEKLAAIPWMSIFTPLGDTQAAIGGWVAEKLAGIPWMAIFTPLGDTQAAIGGWVAEKLAGIPWMSIFTALGDTQAAIGAWLAGKLEGIPWAELIDSAGTLAASVLTAIQDAITDIDWPDMPSASDITGWFKDKIGLGGDDDTPPEPLPEEGASPTAPSTTRPQEGPPLPQGFAGNPFATFISQVNEAKTAFATALTGIRADSEAAKTSVVAALTGIQAGGLPPIAALATAVGASFLALQTQSTGSALATQAGVVGQFVAMQAGAIAQATSLKGGVGVAFAATQADGTSKASQLNAMVKAQFAAMQGGATGSATTMNAGVSAAISAMRSSGTTSASILSSQAQASLNAMRGGSVSAANQTQSGVVNALSAMKSGGAAQASEMMNRVKGNIGGSGAEGAARAVGANIGASLAFGLASNLGAVAAAAANLIAAADRGMKAKALIASPSKLFTATGVNIGGSVAGGIEQMAMVAARAAGHLIDAVHAMVSRSRDWGLDALGGIADIVRSIDTSAATGRLPTARGRFYESLGGDAWHTDNKTSTNMTDTMKVIADSLASVLKGGEWQSDTLLHLPTQAIKEMTQGIGRLLIPFEGQGKVFEDVFAALKRLVATGTDGGLFAGVPDAVESGLTTLADRLRNQFGVITAIPAVTAPVLSGGAGMRGYVTNDYRSYYDQRPVTIEISGAGDPDAVGRAVITALRADYADVNGFNR